MDTDRGEACVFDLPEQACHAVDKGLAADEANVGMMRGLPNQMLARAEANFEPDLFDRRRERLLNGEEAGSARGRRKLGSSASSRRSFRSLKGRALRRP